MNVMFRRNPYEEDWRDRIEAEAGIGRRSAFSHWFDDTQRDFFYLNKDELSETDEDIIEVLDDEGYDVIDYKQGIAQRRGGSRQIRIGKLLQKLKKNSIKKVREWDPYDVERHVRKAEKFWDELIRDFQISAYRDKTRRLVVVISADIHDIAKMSTDRDWGSCMTLGSGSQHENVFCEVREGGLIAYLTEAGDNDIENPLARIHIRRFTNRDGFDLAIPEESSYGKEVGGFREAVAAWLNQRQPEVPIGAYRLRGGQYSDTFGSSHFYFPKNLPTDKLMYYLTQPNGPKEFQTPFWRIVNIDAPSDLMDESYDEYRQYDEYIESLEEREYGSRDDAVAAASGATSEIDEVLYMLSEGGDSTADQINWFYDKMEKQHAEADPQPVTWLFDVEEDLHDESQDVRKAAAIAIIGHPDVTENQLKTILSMEDKFPGTHARTVYSKLCRRRPDLCSWKFVEKYKLGSDILSGVPDVEDLRDDIISRIEDAAMHPEFLADSAFRVKFASDVLVVAGKIFNPIPEPTIRKMIDLSEKYKSITEERHRVLPPSLSFMQSHTLHDWKVFVSKIVSTFTMSGSDTPSVQNFYMSLVPYMEDDSVSNFLDVQDLGFAIMKLGENGSQFIPIFERMISKIEAEHIGPPDPNARIAVEYERIMAILEVLKDPHKPRNKRRYRFFR